MMTETTVTVTSNDAPPSSQPAVKTDSGYQGQGALSWLKINIAYFKSIPGIIKIIQLSPMIAGTGSMSTPALTWSEPHHPPRRPDWIREIHFRVGACLKMLEAVSTESVRNPLLYNMLLQQLAGHCNLLKSALHLWDYVAGQCDYQEHTGVSFVDPDLPTDQLKDVMISCDAHYCLVMWDIWNMMMGLQRKPGPEWEHVSGNAPPHHRPWDQDGDLDELFGILCMALASPAYRSGTHWFLFVATVSFITTLIWVFVYLLSIREALKLPINWILTELLNTAMDTILYTIAFIVQLAVWADFYYWYRGANIAAGVFGILNALAYAAGTYFLYIEWKGTTTTTSSTTTAA